MDNGSANGAGIGFFSLLCVLFIGLKLTSFIDWPWWAVLFPLWGPFVLVLVVLVLTRLISLHGERKNRS